MNLRSNRAIGKMMDFLKDGKTAVRDFARSEGLAAGPKLMQGSYKAGVGMQFSYANKTFGQNLLSRIASDTKAHPMAGRIGMGVGAALGGYGGYRGGGNIRNDDYGRAGGALLGGALGAFAGGHLGPQMMRGSLGFNAGKALYGAGSAGAKRGYAAARNFDYMGAAKSGWNSAKNGWNSSREFVRPSQMALPGMGHHYYGDKADKLYNGAKSGIKNAFTKASPQPGPMHYVDPQMNLF
jgi:hypothetical protein